MTEIGFMHFIPNHNKFLWFLHIYLISLCFSESINNSTVQIIEEALKKTIEIQEKLLALKKECADRDHYNAMTKCSINIAGTASVLLGGGIKAILGWTGADFFCHRVWCL